MMFFRPEIIRPELMTIIHNIKIITTTGHINKFLCIRYLSFLRFSYKSDDSTTEGEGTTLLSSLGCHEPHGKNRRFSKVKTYINNKN